MTRRKRDELAVAHAPVVRMVVRCLAPSLPRHWETEDLEGWGALALLEALERYQPARSGQITAYLRCKIRFGILDSLRVADQSRRKVDRPFFVGVEEAGRIPDRRTADVTAAVLIREVWDAIDQLPERWRLMMRLYYQHECTMRECGLVLGIGESRTSQMHARALRELRKILSIEPRSPMGGGGD